MPRTITLKHPLDDNGLLCQQTPAEPIAPAPAVAVADVSRYSHPHFQRAEPGQYEGWITYWFAPFTGREPRPEVPSAVYDDKTTTYEQRKQLSNQYRAARTVWSQARLRLLAGPLLREAGPVWEEWQTALAELRRVFKGFWETEDGRWRMQLLRLTDAEQVAKKAAVAWDQVAEKLAKLAEEQIHVAGERDELRLTTVAEELGLDASAWSVDLVWEYETSYGHSTPLVEALTREINEQRERLRKVAQLAGDVDLAHHALA
ncbi:hypothetical protein [Streptomyces violaceusniger]|uniref:Uncharacterized protein n=1 Tax=Streptomyces violaceusniger (strain Tu 4113) TaxID=653045 RepID=G2PGU2_STRV4|nr:hypothetical protein [Streptomyces violaceusniger]AEM88656.1 hypothetical protein Strvi_9399 [Streptomyces violaceusniger Tu 4113]